MSDRVVIIGASAAGLATAYCLKQQKIPYIILEQNNIVRKPWRDHYDSLRLAKKTLSF